MPSDLRPNGLRVRLNGDGTELRLYYSGNHGDIPNKRQRVKWCERILEDALRDLRNGKIDPGGQGAGRVAGYADLLIEEVSGE